MNDNYAELITQFPLFLGHTQHGAKMLLERGEVREHAAGEVMFREGDAPTAVLLVLVGKVQVFVERQGQTMVLTEVGPGTILGELGVLCGISRSASLRATEKVVALYWESAAFRRLLLSNPLLSEKIMSQSLRTLVEKEQVLIDSLGKMSDRNDQTG